jgi:hypothetical protein
MSLAGQTRKSARLDGMSVLPSTADVVGPPRHVSKVPLAELSLVGRLYCVSAVSNMRDAKRRIGTCDDDVIRLNQAVREADRAASLDDLAFHRKPLPNLRGTYEIDRERNRRQPRGPAYELLAAIGHCVVCKGCDQTAVSDATRIRVRLGDPQSDNNGVFRPLRIERLPGVGKRAFAEMRFKSFGNIGSHGKARCVGSWEVRWEFRNGPQQRPWQMSSAVA